MWIGEGDCDVWVVGDLQIEPLAELQGLSSKVGGGGPTVIDCDGVCLGLGIDESSSLC